MASKRTTKKRSAGQQLARGEHTGARDVYQADRLIREVEVLGSDNPKRIRRYFARKLAYRLFGKLMGKTLNRL